MLNPWCYNPFIRRCTSLIVHQVLCLALTGLVLRRKEHHEEQSLTESAHRPQIRRGHRVYSTQAQPVWLVVDAERLYRPPRQAAKRVYGLVAWNPTEILLSGRCIAGSWGFGSNSRRSRDRRRYDRAACTLVKTHQRSKSSLNRGVGRVVARASSHFFTH
jgi:hypothetical protein